MTDKQKGLRNAIAGLFSGAAHRHCVRHLYNNFKAKYPGEGLKQLVWNAARSTTRVWFNKWMDEIKELNADAWGWFQDKDRNPVHWSRAFFEEDCKCDILLNNLCESFNSAILPFRDKPILTMFEKIRMDMLVRQANRRVACEKWNDIVGPRIKKIIDKIGERASLYKAARSAEFIYQITGGGENGSQHAVDLTLHTCTCKRWQLSGLPCVHAIRAIRFKKQESTLYCDDYLMCSFYMEAYNPIIYPIAGQDEWEEVEFPIAPPLYKQQPGRPKMKRIKEPGEQKKTTAPPAPKEGKLPRTRIKISCRVCGKQGHNKLGCPVTKAAAAASEGASTSPNTSNKRKRTSKKPKRAPLPKGCVNLKEQIIKSRKTWKKIKETVGDNTTSVGGSSSTSHQPPTQCSQNAAAQRKASKPTPPS